MTKIRTTLEFLKLAYLNYRLNHRVPFNFIVHAKIIVSLHIVSLLLVCWPFIWTYLRFILIIKGSTVSIVTKFSMWW